MNSDVTFRMDRYEMQIHRNNAEPWTVALVDTGLETMTGSILKVYADRAGVIYTVSDGDQPGVTLNLAHFVLGLGVKLVLCGNIKGPYPAVGPEPQHGNELRRWQQNQLRASRYCQCYLV